jgi:transposase-like protein
MITKIIGKSLHNTDIYAESDRSHWAFHKQARKPRQRWRCVECKSQFAVPRSESIDIIDKNGRFCSLRCAARYAVAGVDGI